MEDFKNISKVIACLIGGMAFFYFYFFVLIPSREDTIGEVLEDCVPLQYDFKVISSYQNRYYNFEGKTNKGRIVKFKLPQNWDLDDVCSGDSIHKLAGEKEIYVIKPDTTIKVPLMTYGEEI